MAILWIYYGYPMVKDRQRLGNGLETTRKRLGNGSEAARQRLGSYIKKQTPTIVVVPVYLLHYSLV